MTKKDFLLVLVIGAAVGLLAQPIIANFAASIARFLPLSGWALRAGAFVFFLVVAPVALFIASLVGKLLPVLYQFAKFAAVGTLNSFVDLGIFNLETFLLGSLPGTALFAVFKAISFLCATTNSYFWNKFWTFGAGESAATGGEVAKFYGIAVAGGLVNVGVATLVRTASPGSIPANLWVNIIAPLAGIFAALLWNFIGYKYFVFRRPATPAATS